MIISHSTADELYEVYYWYQSEQDFDFDDDLGF